MESSHILLILLSMVFSAFFSGMEIAFVSANKLKIELENKQGLFSSKLLAFFLKNQSRFIGAMLVDNNIALVIYGIFMGQLLEPMLYKWFASNTAVLLVQTIISTLLILVSAEFLPKTIFRINPNKTLSLFSVPVTILYFLLYPVVLITIVISEFILKVLFRVEQSDEKPVFGKTDLDDYLKQATEANTLEQEEVDHEIQIFQNALDFTSVKARECMIPRNEIIALDIEDTIESLAQKFIDTGLSKILIYRDNIDNIIGFTHCYDLFSKPEFIKNILHPIEIIPESMPANEIMEELSRKKKSVAVVVDEFGGTSGMITIEDVIEEIFGEIEDEHDKEALIEQEVEPYKFVFSARHEIDYLNEKYELKLPESEDYETLAGLIIHYSESIPEVEEKIQISGFRFRVLKVDNNRILEVEVKIQE